jgi:hypothetical protein
MNVRLTSKQRDMLVEVTQRFNWNRTLKIENHVTFFLLNDFAENDAADLRELCSDYLLEVGFDETYTANEKGEILEELVDKLYVE